MNEARRPTGRPLTLAAALLLSLPLTQPALGQDPPPLPEARATVSGTVSSLAGSTVRILNDLVAFDASTARILTSAGPATLAAVTVGSRVFAGVESTAAGLVASTVVVEQPPAGTLVGLIDAIDTAARTLTVEGITVKVTSATVFGGLAAGSTGGPGGGVTGSHVGGLEDLRVNQLVSVTLAAEGGSLSAVRVQLMAPVPLPTVHFRGTVKEIGSTAWVITVSEASVTRDVQVGVDADTRIVGSPKQGDRVEVLGSATPSGAILATLIAKMTPTEPPQQVTFDGEVRSIQGPVWTVGSQRVFVSPMTTITGSPKVGDAVTVTGYRIPNAVMATSIKKK